MRTAARAQRKKEKAERIAKMTLGELARSTELTRGPWERTTPLLGEYGAIPLTTERTRVPEVF